MSGRRRPIQSGGTPWQTANATTAETAQTAATIPIRRPRCSRASVLTAWSPTSRTGAATATAATGARRHARPGAARRSSPGRPAPQDRQALPAPARLALPGRPDRPAPQGRRLQLHMHNKTGGAYGPACFGVLSGRNASFSAPRAEAGRIPFCRVLCTS